LEVSCNLTHAVVIQVKLDPNSDVEHRHAILNDFVIPAARALPGFQKGIWMNDGAGTGTCVVVFDNRDHAESAIEPMTPAAGPPVISAGVHKVEIEA
jgi:hypothetical protein